MTDRPLSGQSSTCPDHGSDPLDACKGCRDAERDRLRAQADKWHQAWVSSHNSFDRLLVCIRENLMDGDDWLPGTSRAHALIDAYLEDTDRP